MTKKYIGVLILHGFPDNLDSIRAIADPIRDLQIPIRTPLLRGHGTASPEALRGVTWRDWFADAEGALTDLLNEAEKAIIIGYSMGGAITLLLAASHPEVVDSIVLTAAAVKMTSPLAPGRVLNFLAPLVALILKKWDFPPDPKGLFQGSYPWAPMDSVISFLDLSRTTRDRLAEVRVPTLILQSRKDEVVDPESMEIIYDRISTPPGLKRKIWFDKTGHDMFHDCEHEAVIEVITKYVMGRVST